LKFLSGLLIPIAVWFSSAEVFAPMSLTRAKWIKFLIAVLLGNALYFALSPHLPPAAQHQAWAVDLGTVVDFWFCLLVYGLLELGAFFRRSDNGNNDPKE
jgi:hypothetical protein